MIAEFINSKEKSKFNILKNILNNRTDWHSKADFYNILKKERNRSDRTGSPFSYILIDLTQHTSKYITFSENIYQKFLKEFLNLISSNTRDYDVKYIDTPYKFGILLVDTSMYGAKLFIEKMTQKIFEYFYKKDNPEFIKIIKSIVLSSYPKVQISETMEINATPLITKKLDFNKNGSDKNPIYHDYQKTCNFSLNWKMTPFSDGTISLSQSLFFDFLYRYKIRSWSIFFKRLLDLMCSCIGIIIFLPLMLFIGMSIKLTSNGPILFKQKRLGYLGRSFTFLKFRTMKVNNDENIHKDYVKKLINGKNEEVNRGSKERPLYKIENDPRITFIGSFLRKTSLDELPQLFNVLEGSMSLVGPRPPIHYEVENYQNWHLRRILQVKPGITGLWQVSGRSITTFNEMVRMDLQYAENQRLSTDIKIILKTFAALINFRGAL